MELSLRAHTQQSYVAFSSLVAATAADPILNGTLEDLHGRFKVWADNIGAFNDEESRTSINYRLRNAPRISESVRSGLLRLENVCDRAITILSNDSKNQVETAAAAANQSDDDEYDDAIDQRAARLEQLLLSIKSTVNYLFGLSAILRRDLPSGRQPHLPQFHTEGASPDITYVADKFPKLRDVASAWLARRLGNAIASRRQYIRDRQEHRQRSAAASTLQVQATLNWPTLTTGFAATSSEDRSPSISLPLPRATTSVVSAATSFMSTRADGSIPSLDSLFLEGVQLRYGDSFECPFCRTVQTVENERDWHQHVFGDLQPYICLTKGCTSQAFTTMHEWMDHDMTEHHGGRREIWTWPCPICPPATTSPLTSSESMEEHLRSHHHATATQAKTLANGCKAEAAASTAEPAVCPFCTDFDTTATSSPADPSTTTTSGVIMEGSRDYYRHVAFHQRQLALQSIPLSIDGLEVEEDPDEASVVDDGPPTPSHPTFPGDAASNVAIRDSSVSLYSKSDVQAVAKPKPLKCDTCGREFDMPHRLNHHMRYHQRPHMCESPGCGRKFGTKTHLDRHVSDKHTSFQRYHSPSRIMLARRMRDK